MAQNTVAGGPRQQSPNASVVPKMPHIHLAEADTVHGKEDYALREALAMAVVRNQFRSGGGGEGGQALAVHHYATTAMEAADLVGRWAVPMDQPTQAEVAHIAESVLPAEGTAVAVL